MNPIFKKPILEEVNYTPWLNRGMQISVLREDLVHPYISGNKWRKLKYNLVDFNNSEKKILLTFGGAFSNHLVATAAAANEFGFEAIGIVRGEEVENPYLKFIRKKGMKLQFVSRNEYKNKSSDHFIKAILNELYEKSWITNNDEVFILPEGGSNEAAVKGASEIMDEIPSVYDYVACACGTGATITGLSKKLLSHQKVIGISALKTNGYFEKEIARLGGNPERVSINYNYHCGGYAKSNKELTDFCTSFIRETNIPIEPVYTGKLFNAIDDMIKKDYFKTGTKVTIIHTGGVFDF